MTIGRLDCEVDGTRTTQLVAFGDDAQSGRSVVGTVELLFLKANAKVTTPRRSACIRMLYVHRSFRMQGIGRRLVDEACAIARRYGCETLGLSLAVDNYSAAEFYQKLGFLFAYEYDDGSMLVSRSLSAIPDPQSEISQ
jgi:ribosomal protein S18 acetylase RimI-like enzyme